MSGKDVSFDYKSNDNLVSSFFVSEVYLTGILGTTMVRKGMLGSLPPGLLTPIVPCCIIH